MCTQVPSQRANSHIIPEAGIHECVLVGTCKSHDNHVIMHQNLPFCCPCIIKDVLKFDNSYSWARSKEVFYSVKLVVPTVEPHPQPRPPPIVHVEIPQEKEVEPLCWTLCPSPSAFSSEDEFFDCVQEQETLSVTLSLSPRQAGSQVHPSRTPLCRKVSSASTTSHRSRCRQIITGTSISTQV